MVFYTDYEANWMATHFAVFDVILRWNRQIHQYKDGFPAIRALERVLFHDDNFSIDSCNCSHCSINSFSSSLRF